jgi:hypothetical protein
MLSYLIICRTQTQANRAATVLRTIGIGASVLRPPAAVSANGCTHALRVNGERIADALTALKNGDFDCSKVYLYRADGTMDAVDIPIEHSEPPPTVKGSKSNPLPTRRR